MITIWHVHLAFLMGAVFCLASVVLGAYAVYRTKREPHESFWGAAPKASVFNLPDDVGTPSLEEEESHPSTFNRDFMNKFMNEEGDRDG